MPKVKKQMKPAKRDNAEQSRAFIEKAREVGADEERPDADAMMRVLHKKPPEQHKKAATRK